MADAGQSHIPKAFEIGQNYAGASAGLLDGVVAGEQ
jgi:hypothetical protein